MSSIPITRNALYFSEEEYKASRLPFVQETNGIRQFWSVKPTGSYGDDCCIGARYAGEFLAPGNPVDTLGLAADTEKSNIIQLNIINGFKEKVTDNTRMNKILEIAKQIEFDDSRYIIAEAVMNAANELLQKKLTVPGKY